MASPTWQPGQSDAPPTSRISGDSFSSHPPAPLFRRFLAYLIDIALFLIIAIPISVGIWTVLFLIGIGDRMPTQFGRVIGAVIFAGLTALCLSQFGATPGKWVMGLRVVTSEGRFPEAGPAAGRALTMVLLSPIAALPWWPLLWRSDRRGLHDQAAGTMVVIANAVMIPRAEQWIDGQAVTCPSCGHTGSGDRTTCKRCRRPLVGVARETGLEAARASTPYPSVAAPQATAGDGLAENIVQPLASHARAAVSRLDGWLSSAAPANPAEHWLGLLKDGTPEQQAQARTELGLIFERRGQLDEAAEAYYTNVQARVRDRRPYERLAAISRQRGDDAYADHVLAAMRTACS